jgi:hypothetical protein
MWAILYEKARVAKLEGGYGFFDSGTGCKAFNLFNFHPFIYLWQQNEGWFSRESSNIESRTEVSGIYQELNSYIMQHYLVITSIWNGYRQSSDLEGTGLISRHVYSVLRIAELLRTLVK